VKIFAMILAAALLVGCGSESKKTTEVIKPTNKPVAVEGLKDLALAEPIVYKNVTLIPVVSTKEEKGTSQDYASLEEAKKNGWVEIIEKPGDQEVNSLRVRNTGPKPILLLAGQLLVGGKQDRIVGKDTIVPPNETIDVPVYCVEHGRWDGPSEKFEYRDLQVPRKIKDAAMYGQQQDVWDGVADYNARMKAAPSTSTVMGGLSSPQVQKNLDEGLTSLAEKLKANPRIVGVIYAVNGHIETLELFGAPQLWTSSMDGVIRGMLADASSMPESGGKPVEMDEAKAFILNALNSRRSVAAINGGEAARVAQDKNLMQIDGDGIRGQEMTADAPASAKSADERSILHGTYSNEQR
jgi:hypothetical protein